MSNANAFGTWFVVRHMVVVDRPELRDDSFKPVPAGTLLYTSTTYETQVKALAYARDLIAGEYDFGSEFVAWVEVNQCYPNRSPRVVRKRVQRDRTGAETAA